MIRSWVVFVLDLPIRRIEIAGISDELCGSRTEHSFRSLFDGHDGFLLGSRYLIHDRDPLFTAAPANLLQGVGLRPIRLPPRNPNPHAHAEHFVRSNKGECLDRLINLGGRRLADAIDEYVGHYHNKRPHQSIGNIVIQLSQVPPELGNPVARRDRFGGLLRSCYRIAA